jgi:SAM-dependent methyltransferase
MPWRDGIVQALPPELAFATEQQRLGWRLYERGCGTLPLSPERAADLPAEPGTRAQLEWLRATLRSRGPCRVLEIGAGRGWAARALAEDGHQVVALDLLDDPDIGLGWAVRQRTQTGRWFGCVRGQAERPPFRPESFDCVFCFATVQHILDLERALHEVSRVLRPGGMFVAFQDAYRGLLCTPWRRRQGGVALTATARDGEDLEAEKARGKPGRPLFNLAYGPHEMSRRVLPCLELAAAAGLRGMILPDALLPQVRPDWSFNWSDPTCQAGCLHGLAGAYELDDGRLKTWIGATQQTTGRDLLPLLMAHWISVGNLDGVWLARKSGEPFADLLGLIRSPVWCRQLEPLLLACSRYGYLPAYGVAGPVAGHDGRTRWLLPEAGFLVPADEFVDFTFTALGPPVNKEMVRLEVRRESETHATVIILIPCSQTSTLRVPLAPPTTSTGTALVHVWMHPVVYSRGDGTGGVGEIRGFAGAQLRGVRAAPVSPDLVAGVLARSNELEPRAA